MDRSEILGGWALPPGAWLAVVGRGVDHLWRRRIQVTQREGRDSDFQQNEAHKVTLVTSTPDPRMFIPL